MVKYLIFNLLQVVSNYATMPYQNLGEENVRFVVLLLEKFYRDECLKNTPLFPLGGGKEGERSGGRAGIEFGPKVCHKIVKMM